jgi:hypothetical protein
MLEIRKTAVSFDGRDLMDLERSFSISQEVHLRPYFAPSAGETQISSGFHELTGD